MRVSAQGEFTQTLWELVEPIYNQIINCQFVVELADATLPESCFAFYLSQDVLYLKQDNKALEMLCQRGSAETEKQFFKQLSQDGIAVEQAMRNDYLTFYNIQEAKQQSPAFKEYGSFILDNAANALYSVALAALLPCFWLYQKIGRYIISSQVKPNQYQKFIDTYIDESYDQVTNHFIQLVEDYGQQVSLELKDEMRNVFLKSAQYEYLVFKEVENIKSLRHFK